MDTNGFKQIYFCECKSKIWEFKEKNLTYRHEKGTYPDIEPRFIESSHGVIELTTLFQFLFFITLHLLNCNFSLLFLNFKILHNAH
jgi:hypothetical protein